MGPVLLWVVKLVNICWFRPARVAHARHDLHQLRRVAALNGKLRDHLLVQRMAHRTGIGGHHDLIPHHLDLLLGGADFQFDVRDVEVVPLGHRDLPLLPASEPIGRDRDRIGGRLDCREIEDSRIVRNRLALRIRGLIGQRNGGLWNDGSASIRHCAADVSSGVLARQRQAAKHDCE